MKIRDNDFEFVTRDFEFFFREYDQQLIFDEAQQSPELFKQLRGVIDDRRAQKNRFLLTGSSSPQLMHKASESLAGRIAIVELGTFKMNEIQQMPHPPLYEIFRSPLGKDSLTYLKNLKGGISHSQVMRAFLKGGYPEPVLSGDDKFHSLWMENYFQTYVQRDVRALFPRLDLIKYQRFVTMLSELNGTIVNRAEVGRSINASEVTIRDYLDIAHGSYLWRSLPSFDRSKSKSIIKMPKGTFRDGGLANYLLGIKTGEDLLRHPRSGVFFESFITEEIIKGLSAADVTRWEYYYYRTRSGAEIDLILQGEFGLLPIEIKFGIETRLRQLRSLSAFIKEQNLPFGIIINNSDKTTLLADKIIQLPASLV